MGPRKSMEDRSTCVRSVNADKLWPSTAPEIAYFGVFDGHNGEDTSTLLSLELHHRLLPSPDAFIAGEPGSRFREVFRALDNEHMCGQLASQETSTAAVKFSGSTAVVCVVVGPTPASSLSTLYVANVGDSRAVLSRGGVAISLTTDQLATRDDEKARIEAAGGWVHNGRLNGVLAVSRAFGDVEHKLLKEKCWEKTFVSDPLIVDPVCAACSRNRIQLFSMLWFCRVLCWAAGGSRGDADAP